MRLKKILPGFRIQSAEVVSSSIELDQFGNICSRASVLGPEGGTF